MSASAKEEMTVESEARKNMKLDRILVEEIGQFGRYQRKVLGLSAIVAIFAAWSSTEYIFTTARINTRCLIRECDPAEPEYSPEWVLSAVPSSGSGFDNCQRYRNTSALVSDGDSCPSYLFDTDVLIPCDEYVYENTHSVAYDYGLACDEWSRSLIGSLRTVGTLTALIITGYISDRWGRRVAYLFNAINTAWLGIVRYWANTYIGFVVSEFIEATFGSGLYSTAYILVMEVMGPQYRVAAGAFINTFGSVGYVAMGLIAWGVPNWRNLTLTLYVPQLLTICYIWFINESVRWYMCKGRYAESEALLQKIAKVNRKTLSPKSLEALRLTAEDEKKKQAMEAQEKSELLLVTVFRHKKVLVRCLVTPVWWITTTFVYYGMSLNSVYISGNPYLNYVAVSAVEIPGYWTAVFFMGRIGRKPVLITAFWICSLCQVAYIFIPVDMYGVSLTAYLIGKYSIAMVVTSVYLYTTELYPTKHRHSLFGFSSMMGRIGSIIAPLTPAFGAATFDELPFVLFGSLALVAGLLTFLTPETLGTKLPDTMEEADNIGKNYKTI